jgi:hypothetical protein
VEVACGETSTLDFAITCVEVAYHPRSVGFWKHQVGVALGGNGQAQFDGSTLCVLLDLIESHFNSNQLNQVEVYMPPLSGQCADKLEVAKVLLNLKGSTSMTDRAKQQLMALLLNVAAGNVGLTQSVSLDGASLSQAITYCDQTIDNPFGDHQRAKDICDAINNGRLVEDGQIPLNTSEIWYKAVVVPSQFALSQNYPNPFNPSTSFTLSLPVASSYSVRIFNAVGQLVKAYSGYLSAGVHTIIWDGRSEQGSAVSSGTYLYRAEASGFVETRSMTVLK